MKHNNRNNTFVCGIGINDSNYTLTKEVNGKRVRCNYYQVWKDMLKRCYSDKYQEKRPTYKGCTVCDEWLSFMSFRKWMMKQDWEGKQLDKDILVMDNKVYSPETCIFVNQEINLILVSCEAKRGDWPQGVYYHKSARSFQSSIRKGNERKYLGLYDTPEEASNVYRKEKALYIYETALQQEDVILGRALLKHGDMYASKLIPTTHKSGETLC